LSTPEPEFAPDLFHVNGAAFVPIKSTSGRAPLPGIPRRAAPPRLRTLYLLRNAKVRAQIEQLAVESYLTEFIQQSLHCHPLTHLGGKLYDLCLRVRAFRGFVDAHPTQATAHDQATFASLLDRQHL
jgi:hypothetical protein